MTGQHLQEECQELYSPGGNSCQSQLIEILNDNGDLGFGKVKDQKRWYVSAPQEKQPSLYDKERFVSVSRWPSCEHALSFDEALRIQEKAAARIGYVTGFVINGLQFVVVDIDDHHGGPALLIDDGVMTPYAKTLLNLLFGTSEILCFKSIGGRGIHVPCWITVQWCSQVGKTVKQYQYSFDKIDRIILVEFRLHSYIVHSGVQLTNGPMLSLDEDDFESASEWLQEGDQKVVSVQTELPSSDPSKSLTDDQLIEKCLNSKNGPQFRDLYTDGNVSRFKNDFSRADMALVGALVFFSPCRDQIKRIWRQSALSKKRCELPDPVKRRKLERDDYLDRTITKALSTTRDPWWAKQRASDLPTAISENAVASTELPCLLSGYDLFHRQIERANPLVEGLIQAGDRVILCGPSKIGKSFLLIQLAISLATAHPFLAFKVPRKCQVLYLNLELPVFELRDRLAAAVDILWRSATDDRPPSKQLYGVDNPQGQTPIFELGDLLHNFTTNSNLAICLADVEKLVASSKPDVVIVDPLYLLNEMGEENKPESWCPLMRTVDKIRSELGSTFIFAQHDRKSQGRATVQKQNIWDRGAGSSIISRWVDGKVAMTPEQNQPDEVYLEFMLRHYLTPLPIPLHRDIGENGLIFSPSARELSDPQDFRKRALEQLTVEIRNAGKMAEKDAIEILRDTGLTKAAAKKLIKELVQNQEFRIQRGDGTGTNNAKKWITYRKPAIEALSDRTDSADFSI